MGDRQQPRQTVEAVFSAPEVAHHAADALRDAGLRPQVHDDATTAGRSGERDDAIAGLMVRSFTAGAATGTVAGAALGALIGGLTTGWLTVGWLAITIALAVAGGGVGALWGMMGGFTRRRARRGNFSRVPISPPKVRVEAVTAEQARIAREILSDSGGDVVEPSSP